MAPLILEVKMLRLGSCLGLVLCRASAVNRLTKWDSATVGSCVTCSQNVLGIRRKTNVAIDPLSLITLWWSVFCLRSVNCQHESQ